MDKRLSPASIALLYAAFAAAWIFASDKLLALALPDTQWLLRISTLKGIAFVIVTTVLLFLLLQSRGGLSSPGEMPDQAEDGAPRTRKLIVIFLGLSLIAPLFGFGIDKLYSPRVKQAAFDDLAAIAGLKKAQIETWLQERSDDADELAERLGFTEKVEQWLKKGDMNARTYVLARMATLARLHGYDPVMLDVNGRHVMPAGLPSDPLADKVWQELLVTALSSGKPQRSELFRDSAGRIRLDYVIPLRLSNPQRSVGVIVLRAPVERFLFPLIQSWPTASASAEMLLTRRDGDHLLLLNELRHRQEAALSLRLPLDSHGLNDAAGILIDEPLSMEGVDYRGVRVLAVSRQIAGTGWHLLAKMDMDEVMAPLNERLLWVSLLAIIVVMVAASAVLLIWRQQQRLHCAELHARTAEKDEQLKLFYELPFIGMAISSPVSKAWLYANDYLCNMLGYSREELLQTTWANITHPDDLPGNVAQFERMIAGEIDGYTLEKRFLRKDGSPVTVNLDIKCTRGADGKVNHIVAMIEDITARKRAELALRESEDRFRSIFTNAIDGIVLADAKTRKFIMGNAAIGRMLGYDSAELLRIGLEDIHLEHDIAYNVAQFEKMVHGESSLAANIPVKRKDGSLFFADIHAAPITIDGKNCLMGMFRDISERKKTEDSLRQAATVFESSHDGIAITDPYGNILAVNQSFQKITGYTEHEVLGQNLRILKSDRQGQEFYQGMWADITSVGYWQGEIWNRRKNGQVYAERLTITAVKNAQGETTQYVGVFSDLSLIKQSEERAEHLAHYDPLTNLPNRLLLQSHLSRALEHARRHKKQLGVLYLDLDRFKNINDSLGYPAGDELLVALVKRLDELVLDEDMLARLGGDEFLLVQEYMLHPDEAANLAQSLLEHLEAPFILSGGREVFIGASIGISIFPDDGDTASELIQHADAAMHQAKKLGRNTYRFYIDSLTRAASEHIELETRLRHAITANQLRVHYQPQIEIASGRIVGAEALVRWQDPQRGLIGPAQFISLAEEAGLVGAIGEWVLRETCRQGVRWIEAGMPFLTLAVNLSPRQFLRDDIADMVSQILAESGFPADRLELELTESALMEHQEAAVKMLHLLRAQDIRLAIDDFGTGYSSLAYLKRFPIDILKIDKSFVDDIPFHKDDMEIAATIIAMGHILGFKVLAEGVETAEQLAFLQAKGCDQYQGYLGSPPLTAEEFEKLLNKHVHS